MKMKSKRAILSKICIKIYPKNNEESLNKELSKHNHLSYGIDIRSTCRRYVYLTFACFVPLHGSVTYAADEKSRPRLFENTFAQVFESKKNENPNQINTQSMSNFNLDPINSYELPRITLYKSSDSEQISKQQDSQTTGTKKDGAFQSKNNGLNGQIITNLGLHASPVSTRKMDFYEAIKEVLQLRPEITQSIANVSAQDANIDASRAQYFPQISGGISTGDFSSSNRGSQIMNVSATQMLYDFGKIKSEVGINEARLQQSQVEVLVNIDDLSSQTANAIINIKRYQELLNIANEQLNGIGFIANIARLRAQAGISTQADPIQAQSNYEAAQSTKILYETNLRQFQQKLRTFIGYDISNVDWQIPDSLVSQSALYEDPEFNKVTRIMLAQTGVEVAKLQKQRTRLSSYPTLNLKGTLSQALNGVNPSNNKNNGFDSSIMVEATSNFYQGGAIAAQSRSANYAEQAAKAQVQTAYLEVVDQMRLIREEVSNKQRQIEVLMQRKKTAMKTKELYQEQYKLGTRTIIDLLNAEQAIHVAAQEIMTARYDIYSAIIRYIEITGRSRDVYGLNHISIQGVEINP